jgi:hypothetical protein
MKTLKNHSINRPGNDLFGLRGAGSRTSGFENCL